MPDLMPAEKAMLPTAGMVGANVVKAMIGVMAQIKEIHKSGYNENDKYAYVYYADVVAATQDALVSNELVMSQREISRVVVGKVLMISYQFDVFHSTGECIYNIASHTGACRFEFKTGSTDDKAANKCYVSAHKYVLLNLFKIPPDDHQTERVFDGDPDAQGVEDPEPPENGRHPRETNHRPRGDDRYHDEGPPPVPPPDDAHSYGEPPPDDAPPFEPPPDEAPGGGFRARVIAFKRMIEDARDENEAHDIWRRHAELVHQVSDATFDFLRSAYLKLWNILPPTV